MHSEHLSYMARFRVVAHGKDHEDVVGMILWVPRRKGFRRFDLMFRRPVSSLTLR